MRKLLCFAVLPGKEIMKKSLFFGTAFAAAAAVLFLCLFIIKPAEPRAAVASGGKIYLENIDVTGMNYDEVQAVINDKMNKYLNDTIEVYADDATAYIDAAEMGLFYANTDLADIISSMGMNGNVLSRYNIDNYISRNGALFFSLDLRVDPAMVYNVVTAKVETLNRAPANTKLGRNLDGSFFTIPKKDGFHILLDETVEGLTNYLCTSWHGGVGGYRAPIEVEEATGWIGEDDINLITSELGRGSTQYEIAGKYVSRAANISNAVDKINGTIVYPGETFSTEKAMEPFTQENGYQYAAGYENGYVVDTIGGGICQVSSTLYRAVLESELEVTERHQHSMAVGYVDPSMDATIAEDSLDFKFTNTTDAPIYIEGVAFNGTVTFVIFGHETRPKGRTIEFESETFEYLPAEIKITLDENLEYGNCTLVEPHDGLSARAYKIVYQDGVEVGREYLTSSYYVKADGSMTVGVKNAPEKALPEIQAAAARGNVGELFILSGFDLYGGIDGDRYALDDAIALIADQEGTAPASGDQQTGEQTGGQGDVPAEGTTDMPAENPGEMMPENIPTEDIPTDDSGIIPEDMGIPDGE